MLRFDVQHVNKSLSLATNFRNHYMLRFDQENAVSISLMELLQYIVLWVIIYETNLYNFCKILFMNIQ